MLIREDENPKSQDEEIVLAWIYCRDQLGQPWAHLESLLRSQPDNALKRVVRMLYNQRFKDVALEPERKIDI